MNTKTLKALEESIEHWQRLADGCEEEIGCRSCPLCKLFIQDNCNGCPVAEKTGVKYCYGSPYQLRDLDSFMGDDEKSHNPSFLKAAKEEVEFLRSMLPGERQEEGKTK